MKKFLLILVTTVTLFFSPLLNYGQAPNLGTAANFVLFATVGVVTNAGVPKLTHNIGNVGSNEGLLGGLEMLKDNCKDKSWGLVHRIIRFATKKLSKDKT